MEGEEVEIMCVESFYNLVCCEGEKNIGAIVGGDYWVRGCFIYLFLRLNDNSTFLCKRNDPTGRKVWSSKERSDD